MVETDASVTCWQFIIQLEEPTFHSGKVPLRYNKVLAPHGKVPPPHGGRSDV